jgi:alpha-beta hydrolase superfamily lysophospholipase
VKRRPGRVTQAVVAVVVIAAVTLGCTAAGVARTNGPSKAAGTLITSIRVSASGVDGTVYAVKYWSRSVHDRPQTVTGLVFVPFGSAPSGGWPVVSYGHPTDGMGNTCAPSLDPSTDVHAVNDLLGHGWEVTATDYQGEGNQKLAPTSGGLQPHGVNLPEAQNIVDIVRAASRVPGAHPSSNYVVWGYSQGGGAAMFSLDVARSYAPELHLRGVVSTAPPANLAGNLFAAPSSPASPFTLMYVAGYHAAYGSKVQPGAVLTQTGKSLAARLGQECYDAIAQAISPYRVDQVFKTTLLPKSFKRLLDANDPLNLHTASATPLLLVQGADDTNDPARDTQLLRNHLCGLGQDVVLWMYPGLDHNSIVGYSTGDIEHWIADRFSGRPNPDTSAPNGVAGIENSRCN